MRLLRVATILTILYFPQPALAVEEGGSLVSCACPQESMANRWARALVTPEGFGVAITVITGIFGGAAGASAIRRRRLSLAVHHAFLMVEEIGNEKEGEDGFDKAAAGLKALDAFLLANKWRPAKPGEQVVASLEFKALNGASKLETKIRADAVAAAPDAGVVPSPVGPVLGDHVVAPVTVSILEVPVASSPVMPVPAVIAIAPVVKTAAVPPGIHEDDL